MTPKRQKKTRKTNRSDFKTTATNSFVGNSLHSLLVSTLRKFGSFSEAMLSPYGFFYGLLLGYPRELVFDEPKKHGFNLL
jgi:hypothetical protein